MFSSQPQKTPPPLDPVSIDSRISFYFD
jgi:hypothetical protein